MKDSRAFKIKRLLTTLVLVTIVGLLGFYVQLDYYVVRPSRAVNLKEIVAIENSGGEDNGAFYLLTITQHRANLFAAAYGFIHPQMRLNPKERVIPRDMDEREYRELLREHMTESKHIAQVVALRRAGYDVDIKSDGVEVIDFLENAPAEGYLEVGDVIGYVDDNLVMLASEVQLLVKERDVGDEVIMDILRNDRELKLSVPTGPHPDDETMPFLGIYIQTRPWEPVIPLDISMDTGNIGGPSAGLMFVLEILNQLNPDDLTAGRRIAGTGTIDLEERVGRVGGVPQKVYAAENAGVEYFLVPEKNYDDARLAAREIELVSVSELEEALQFLSGLQD